MNKTLQTTLLGALGGFLGFLLSELLSGDFGHGNAVGLILQTTLWTALLMLPLTLVLLAADNVLGLRGRWWRGLATVIIPALILGGLSGAIAQTFYGLALGVGLPRRLMRAFGWALMGAGVGLLLGLNDRSTVKALRGMLGGAVGGFIGGLVFDSFAAIRFGESDTGTFPRAIGLTILGAAIGFMLRLTQEFFKTAWLMGTTTGKYEGKQYILTKPVVTVGRSDGNDISFYHDQTVPMQAGALRRDGQTWRWQGESIHLNGRPTTAGELHHGDRLRFGETELLFQEKGKVAPDAAYTQPLLLRSNSGVVALPTSFRHLTLGTRGDVALTGTGIAPQHAEVTVKDGALTLRALQPLLVNDQNVLAGSSVPLRAGDLLTIGDTDFALVRAELEPVKEH